MDTAAIILENGIDKAIIEELESLRLVRLSLAERLFQNLDDTTHELQKRGLVHAGKKLDRNELRTELKKRIEALKLRVSQKNVVFSDELELYSDLLEQREKQEKAEKEKDSSL